MAFLFLPLSLFSFESDSFFEVLVPTYVAKALKDFRYEEYRKVLLEEMKNNPPVGDSEKVIELLEK